MNNNIEVFYALIRAGLWSDVESADLEVKGFAESVDWDEVYRLAEEQSVVGLILAGIEASNIKPPQELLLQWIGEVQILEQQNMAMNQFISVIVDKMRLAGINATLIKGQGVAQCYKRPLWRASGDVDLLLDRENYYKAIDCLKPLASIAEQQDERNMAYGITIEPYIIELHGTLRCGLSRAMDHEIDAIQRDTFEYKHVRNWNNKGVEVLIPAPNNDVFFIFTHIIKHFYKGGIGLRQICDLSQLLWCYRDEMDSDLLLERLRRMKLYDEWRAFTAFIVEYLGHPKDAIPLFDSTPKWSRKARHICKFVMDVGNFGHNRNLTYYGKYNLFIRKVISFWWRLKDITAHAMAFPQSATRFFPMMLADGMQATYISALKNKNE